MWRGGRGKRDNYLRVANCKDGNFLKAQRQNQIIVMEFSNLYYNNQTRKNMKKTKGIRIK